MSPRNVLFIIFRALSRARFGIFTIALTYAISVFVGAMMVHSGNEFALNYRDHLVAQAHANDPAMIALDQSNQLQAALIDFGRNLFGSVSDAAGGMGVVFPYPLVAYRGWIGGIVSVDGSHVSRLAEPAERFYYLVVLVLQIIPYSLAGGIGVNLGIAYFRPRPPYQGDKWFGLPKEALRDVFRAYLLIIPLFLVASLWEFFAR